jgi:hypothetical protein
MPRGYKKDGTKCIPPPAWGRNLKRFLINCAECNTAFYKVPCEVNRKFCSLKCKYKKGHSEETRRKITLTKTGQKHSPESIAKMCRVNKGSLIAICKFCHNLFEKRTPSGQRAPKQIFCNRVCASSYNTNTPEFKAMIKFTHSGEKHHNWVGGPDHWKKNGERNDSGYKAFVMKVKKRDNGICRLQSENCMGYKVVHHILPWRDYPEERYNINNGITLCQYHHPRKRQDEIRLIPELQSLVGSK